MREALIAALASVLGVLAKGLWDTWRASSSLRARQRNELSTAQIEDDAHKRDLLVAAYNQMIQAERAWTQKEIEIERRCYIAEEKLARREDEHLRELRGAQLLSEQQHAIIVQREAEIEAFKREIDRLQTLLDGCVCMLKEPPDLPDVPS